MGVGMGRAWGVGRGPLSHVAVVSVKTLFLRSVFCEPASPRASPSEDGAGCVCDEAP